MSTLPFAPFDGAVPLDDCGVLRAHGADAAAFLHGQLTQDIANLGAGQARLAGYCSPKGRLRASFVAWRPQPDTVYLAGSADVLPAALERLSMFVLRAKCKLADAGGELRLTGVAGASAHEWLGAALPDAPWRTAQRDDALAIRLPDALGVARVLVVQPAAAAPLALPPLLREHWRWLDVASGVVTVVAATTDQFVPQMVNFELTGGVDFHKGCYPGQEVVARSQYRGTLKRRAFVFRSDAPAHAGQEVYAADDAQQPAGMVANAASAVGLGHIALVEVKLAALGGALHLGAPGGPALERVEMPYDVPLEAA